ncbi:MAG: hypothetical protein WBL85_04875 [Sedimentisphaerales bacterium]
MPLDEQISKLQAEISYLKVQYASSDEVLNEARDLYSRWPNLDRAEKRQIIENITEKVVVGEKDITINLCYLPFFSEMMAAKTRHVPAPIFSWRYERHGRSSHGDMKNTSVLRIKSKP